MSEKNPLFDLAGRTALITGSSQGIGLALARGLAQAGAAVVLNSRDEKKLNAAAATVRAEIPGARVTIAAFDVTDGAACHAAVAKIEADFAPIDILINNAGIQHLPAINIARMKRTSPFLLGITTTKTRNAISARP